MTRMRDSIIVLGEGPTEFYYLQSLKDEFKSLQNIRPKCPKHTSLKELEISIKEAIAEGYSKVYCLIDMDNKDNDKEKRAYLKLKQKYSKPVQIKSKGINCEVRFFETHRCTELFFLYYFSYQSKEYTDYRALEKDLQAKCAYEKRQEFFRRHPLHAHFQKNGGTLDNAMKHAGRSIREVRSGARDYTYSDLGEFLNLLRH